ncbi:MAG: hypothetical protein JWN86_947 [Planctomycetota bacterium]|nr:hypothetical protein [Planctomycetota bacterium]
MSDSPFALSLDAWGRLVLIDSEARRHVGVEPVRAFPLSDPSRRISLCDETGREVAWIEDLSKVSPSIRRTIEDELSSREFVPAILKIVHISSDSAPSDWAVVTDRGETKFTLDADEQVRKLEKNRVLIADALGSRYQIPDWKALDGTSRRMLERYL